MKPRKSIITVLLGIILTANFVNAQNYKAPKIDASGKVTNGDGIHIGWITKEGVIKDTAGTKVAYIDNEGNLIDGKTGAKMGKAEKNGNFTSTETKTPDKGWTTSDAQNEICQVKDAKGNIQADIHENYKAQGACAIHCLTKKKK